MNFILNTLSALTHLKLLLDINNNNLILPMNKLRDKEV